MVLIPTKFPPKFSVACVCLSFCFFTLLAPTNYRPGLPKWRVSSKFTAWDVWRCRGNAKQLIQPWVRINKRQNGIKWKQTKILSLIKFTCWYLDGKALNCWRQRESTKKTLTEKKQNQTKQISHTNTQKRQFWGAARTCVRLEWLRYSL